ncbi:hypothetical protein [Oceanirhabdus sp. W0125-5]|nr:hypothetical protein [Oceanirhabdus sp. W0125-5]WBW95850.1 hypothetical protein OW730_19480 [Oceanirhabdus sp. W0125-5]
MTDEQFNEFIDRCYEITAMAVNYLNGLGMYKIPGEKSHLFVALIESED